MYNYFVRVSDHFYDTFYGFCLKCNIVIKDLSDWSINGTRLYMILMNADDATALKLIIPTLTIMRAPT